MRLSPSPPAEGSSAVMPSGLDWESRPPFKGNNDDLRALALRLCAEFADDEIDQSSRLARLLPHFVDAWPVVRGAEPGLTFDGANNPYVRDPDERMRYDRVMVRGLRPARIEMLGEPDLSLQPPEEHPVPSDHLGLLDDRRPGARRREAGARVPHRPAKGDRAGG